MYLYVKGSSLHTDKHYLKTIVWNLTSNAVKALKNTRNATITWKTEFLEQHTMLSISDNGPGADSKTFKVLYDDNETEGIKSGLGLHLIRDLARAIDCVIEVDSTAGSGTIVRLYFSKQN